MIHYKTVEVPATTRQVQDKVICDFCGQEIREQRSYDVDEVTISRRVGESFPSGGNVETFSFDMCSGCWTKKFLVWAKSITNAEPARTDCSY